MEIFINVDDKTLIQLKRWLFMNSVGSRLKKLRQEHGYSQRQVAEYLEIDQSNLSKIENDKRNLSLVLSEKLLALYNCTPEYLLGKTDKYEKPKISFKSARDLDLNVISHINRLSSNLTILRKYEPGKAFNKYPKLNMNFKRNWGIDEFSPVNMFNLLCYKIPNLTISWFPLKSAVSGCYFKKNHDSIILINSSHTRGRQNFTLAHELYHLLENKNHFVVCSEKNDEESEIKADEFASNFLLSEPALYDFMDSNNIEEWSIHDVIKCEQYFQLDHRNFIGRLYSEGFITGDQFAELSFNIFNKAASLGYDTSLYEPNKDNQYYSVGHMIPITEKIYNENKLTRGARKDILLDLFRQDIVY